MRLSFIAAVVGLAITLVLPGLAHADGRNTVRPVATPAPLTAQPVAEPIGEYHPQGTSVRRVVVRREVVQPSQVVVVQSGCGCCNTTVTYIRPGSLELSGDMGVGAGIGQSSYYSGGGIAYVDGGRAYSGVTSHPASRFTFQQRRPAHHPRGGGGGGCGCGH